LPGNNGRTDSLSIIPNLADEKKPDKKSKEKKDESRKTSWGWLLGSDGKDKERDKKEQEEREKELAKKVKNKLSKTQEKSHDDTRLDVLQTSISGGRGRESVVLDRDTIKLEEERKKESSRKSSGGETKKEKDSGLFSSIFGGKKKGEKEASHKKGSSMRGLSPEPPPKILKPDIDYNWTRFSILEERAIYRMAHIKLANPRRELYSQVLLSNFMYSYLAKVQQMHPQIQIGTSKQAKQQQRQQQAAEQRKDQPEEFTQYQRYQQVNMIRSPVYDLTLIPLSSKNMVKRMTMCRVTVLRKTSAQSHLKKTTTTNIDQTLELPNTANNSNSSSSNSRATHIIPRMASKMGTVSQVDKLSAILQAASPRRTMDMMIQIRAVETTKCGEIINDEFETRLLCVNSDKKSSRM
jgi:hypothetical protein